MATSKKSNQLPAVGHSLELPSPLKVHVTNKQSQLKISLKAVKKLVAAVVAHEKLSYHEVGIHFVDGKRISKLHQIYFNDPTITDCISFPVETENLLTIEDLHTIGSPMGDIFVCPEVACAYAEKHGLEPYEELSLYIIHGLLHLMGYDDMEKEKRMVMRAAERRHLRHLKKTGLLLQPI